MNSNRLKLLLGTQLMAGCTPKISGECGCARYYCDGGTRKPAKPSDGSAIATRHRISHAGSKEEVLQQHLYSHHGPVHN